MLQSIRLPIARREWRTGRSGEHTARSVRAAAEAAMAHLNLPLSGAKVAIEGFGSVGSALAALLAERGAGIVAISTSHGAIYNDKGLDVPGLIRAASTFGSRAVEHVDAAQPIERADLLELPVDLLAPCARYHSIHGANAARIRARIICGGANNPLSDEAERLLLDRNVTIVPDFVANCGGVLGGTMDFAAVRPARTDALIDQHLRRLVADLLRESDRRGLPMRIIAEQAAMGRFDQVRCAAEHPTAAGRLFSLGLACHRHGLVPSPIMSALADGYFERRLIQPFFT